MTAAATANVSLGAARGSFGAALRTSRGALAAATLAVIIAGIALRPLAPSSSSLVLLVGLILTGAPIIWRTVLEARQGRWATDVVAVLAIIAAVLLRQPLAGLVIVVMRSGGEALDDYASARASSALRELEDAAPRIAHRLGGIGGTAVEDLAVTAIAVGDLLLVRPGEVVPCDCDVRDGHSLVDVSRLTGEPIPIEAENGT